MPKETGEKPAADRAVLTEIRAALEWAPQRFRIYMTSHRFWFLLCLSVLVTTIAGPFETRLSGDFARRMMYWGILLIPGMLTQIFLSIVLRDVARRLGIAWGWAALAAGVIGTGTMLIYGAFAVYATGGAAPDLPLDESVFHIAVLTITITVGMNAFLPVPQRLWGMRRAPVAERAGAAREEDEGPLFGRLPPNVGRDVIWARADNHHTEIRTRNGHARILMRLSDAEAELSVLPGLRVHRSWWVNLNHATQLETGERSSQMLVMIDGTRVPVARAKREQVAHALDECAAATVLGA